MGEINLKSECVYTLRRQTPQPGVIVIQGVFFNVHAMFGCVKNVILKLSSCVTPHFVPEIIRINHVSKKSMP